MSKSSIKIGGSVGGNVVAGDGNVVGPAAAPSAARPAAPKDGMTPRLGFVVDIIGFGQRSDGEDKVDLQRRLADLVGRVLADLGVEQDDTVGDHAGDEKTVFLPVGVDSSRMLPTLIAAMAERLRRDNRRHTDRMRLRMAVGTGLLGNGPLGFTGDLIVDLHRLVSCDVLRQAAGANPDADLALLVTHALHDEVIRPGYVDRDEFVRVDVAIKEFTAVAWLWLG